MRMRSPSRIRRCGLACSSLTCTLPPSQARLASERVLNRQAMSSQTSMRTESPRGVSFTSLTARRIPSDQDFDLALVAQRLEERLHLALAIHLLQLLLDARSRLFELDGPARLLL